MSKDLETLLDELKAKGEALGDAQAHEQQLEDERPLIKEMAIVRIMERDKCAATPAEKIVKSDLEYMNHRVAQRASVVARFRADAEYEAAKAAATQASLITPSMMELQAKVSDLEFALKQSKREVEVREVATRRANSMLSERIREVEDLTSRNRRFWEAVEEITPRPTAVFHAWASSASRPTNAIGVLNGVGATGGE